jgi:Ser/Thr protein kinase RdoA (MazF antagonist)
MNIATQARDSDRQPITVLERILDEASRTAMLQAAMAELEPGGEQPRESRVKRVHIRSGGGFVIEATATRSYTAELPCFIEIPSEPLADRVAEIARRWEKQCQRLGSRGIAPLPIYADPEYGLFVRPRGRDEMIDGLAALCDPQALSEQLPDNPMLANVELLAHRLNRRAVLRVRSKDGAERIVKLYKKGSSKPQAALAITSLLEQTSFGEDSSVAVPQCTAHLHSWPGYAMNRAPGVQLSDLDGEDELSGMKLAGAALGRLHRLPLRLQENHRLPDELALLQSWTGLVSGIFPLQSKVIRAVLREVSNMLLAGSEPETSLVHRDFHGGQVLVEGQHATLIDFDTICNGESAQDVGNFLGHIDLARLEHVEGGEHVAQAFLVGYAEAHRNSNAARVEAHRRATLLRLACIYAFSDNHRTLWPRLLDLALGGKP